VGYATFHENKAYQYRMEHGMERQDDGVLM